MTELTLSSVERRSLRPSAIVGRPASSSGLVLMRDGLAWILETLVAIVLLYSAYYHLSNPYHFLSSVHAYDVVPKLLGRYAAAYLPFLQLLLAVCVLARIYTSAALLLATMLFGGFAGVQIQALNRGLNIDCGCFGVAASNPVTWSSAATVIGLSITAAVACVLAMQRTSIDLQHDTSDK